MATDPCTPKGYSHVTESWKLSPVFSDEKNRYLSTLQSQGNFSECRSAALTMLQKGKGLNCDLFFIPLDLAGKTLSIYFVTFLI